MIIVQFLYVFDKFSFIVYQSKSPHSKNKRSEKYYKTIFSQRPYFGLYSELKEKAVENGVRMPVDKLSTLTPHRGMIGHAEPAYNLSCKCDYFNTQK